MPVTTSAITAGIGLVQGVAGFFQNRKARKQLERLQSPTYVPASSISDYYSKALQRYNASPYSSTLYNMQAQNAQRATSQGIAGLQSRRSALAGIPALIQGQNDSMLKAASMAEQEKNQQFSQLGQATQMMGAEQRQAFNVNQMMPYEKKYNLLAGKAAGGSQLMNAGLSNIGSAATSFGQMSFDKAMMDKYFGNSKPSNNKYNYQGKYYNWGQDDIIRSQTPGEILS